ncbi:MAG: hypothetical protein ABI076_00945, partial [Acidobacteriaceae bacterium]
MSIPNRSRSLFKRGILFVTLLGALGITSTAALSADSATKGPAEKGGPYRTLLITGAIVIDGTGAPAKGPQDILIKNNVIYSIMPGDPIGRARTSATAVRADRVIDAHGMYVMPGIIDMHMHLRSDLVPADYQYKLLLGQGITTVRVFSIGRDTPEEMVALKRQVAENKVDAPRMYVYPFWRTHADDPRWSNA